MNTGASDVPIIVNLVLVVKPGMHLIIYSSMVKNNFFKQPSFHLLPYTNKHEHLLPILQHPGHTAISTISASTNKNTEPRKGAG